MPHIIKKDGNQFYIGSDPFCAKAVVTYVFNDKNTILIDHTFVSDELRGQGIAKDLVDAVVNYARQENLKIIPLCSYAEWLMKSSEKYGDVLK